MLSRVDLALTHAEACRLSPGILAALLRRRADREAAARKAADLRAGLIAAVIVRTMTGTQVDPADFFRYDDADQYMTPDETLHHLRAQLGPSPHAEESDGHP